MTIECYNTTCRHHCFHSDDQEDAGPYCYRAECREVPLLPGELRSCKRADAVSPWRVWTGSRWQRCWTAHGAALLSQDLKRKNYTLPGGKVATFANTRWGPVSMVVPNFINKGALV